MYVINPSIEHKIDLCEIFFVLPEMKANALDKALTAPSSLIISYEISAKYSMTWSLTSFKLITMSRALDLMISTG